MRFWSLSAARLFASQKKGARNTRKNPRFLTHINRVPSDLGLVLRGVAVVVCRCVELGGLGAVSRVRHV